MQSTGTRLGRFNIRSLNLYYKNENGKIILLAKICELYLGNYKEDIIISNNDEFYQLPREENINNEYAFFENVFNKGYNEHSSSEEHKDNLSEEVENYQSNNKKLKK